MSKKIAGRYMMYTTKWFDERELDKVDTWFNEIQNEIQPDFISISLRSSEGHRIFVTIGQWCEPTTTEAKNTVITAASTDPETGVKPVENAPEGSRLTSKGETPDA